MPAHAQTRASVTAHAVFLASRVSPAIQGEARAEFVLTQPMLGVSLERAGGAVGVRAMLNLEGLTLADGEPSPGVWGEGFVDRRHPHTYGHEMVGWAGTRIGGQPVSITAGRGFVPFGTDDPMARPFVHYPANHHLAQVLERWLVVLAARTGPIIVEVAAFNGDEPVGPSDLGGLERLGDSGAVRLTLMHSAVELTGSHARLESPEWRAGRGRDQSKWSAALRVASRDTRVAWYGLAEWARTDELFNGVRAFTFTSILAEAQAAAGGWSFAVRAERTERPEEERVGDPFRVSRPHADPNVFGITRWVLMSGRTGFDLTRNSQLFVEVTRAAVQEITGSVFRPREFYGDDRLFTLSFGLRLHAGEIRHARPGRYGAARQMH